MHISPSGKRYIGITSQKPKDRWGKDGNGYMKKNSDGSYKQPVIARAILKYPDWNKWKHYIVLSGETEVYAQKAEQVLIKHYKCQDPHYGYNISPGGDVVVDSQHNFWSKITEEKYEHWYNAHIKSWNENKNNLKEYMKNKQSPLLGTNLSDDQKEILRKKAIERCSNPENHPMFGKHHSDASKIKMSESHHGKHIGSLNPMYGRNVYAEMSKEKLEEVKNKMSEARSGFNCKTTKPLYCPEFNEYFWSAKEVQNKYGINRGSISACLKGKLKHAGKHPITGEPLTWKHVTKEEYYNNTQKGE